jgi:hypothetical protein
LSTLLADENEEEDEAINPLTKRSFVLRILLIVETIISDSTTMAATVFVFVFLFFFAIVLLLRYIYDVGKKWTMLL